MRLSPAAPAARPRPHPDADPYSARRAAGLDGVVRLGVAGLLVLAVGCSSTNASTSRAATTPRTGAAPAAAPSGQVPASGDDELLLPSGGGDGDSWRDMAGQEYRLGLVNTPETGECFGSEATRERISLTAAGFYADVYTEDRYGRGVAVVRTVDGRDLNVHLARHGFADDRYLAQFRDENPALATRLDEAFTAARGERRGLWGACQDIGQHSALGQQPPPDDTTSSDDGCHPDYRTCITVQGNGSGTGTANDLDCGALPGAVLLHQPGVDPYRLDADGDGVGCDR